jgi:hypothetical protein
LTNENIDCSNFVNNKVEGESGFLIQILLSLRRDYPPSITGKF